MSTEFVWICVTGW